MKRLLRHSTLLLTSLALAVGGLGVAATATPVAHAASGPSIYGVNEGGGVQVFGAGCNPGASVRVESLDMYVNVLATKTLYADDPTKKYPGTFATLINTSYVGNVHVAMDCQPGPTAWAMAYVFPAPYITPSNCGCGGYWDLEVNGSGFAPHEYVEVQVLILSTLSAIADDWVWTYGPGTVDQDGFMRDLFNLHYTGWVTVRVIDHGSNKVSNWATVYMNG